MIDKPSIGKKTDHILEQYVIYKSPEDYKGKFVVRRFQIIPNVAEPVADKKPTIACVTLEEARKAIPSGFVNIGRFAKDSPSIYEVWT